MCDVFVDGMIVVVGIDEKSLKDFGGCWFWLCSIYVKVIEVVKKVGVCCVIYDGVMVDFDDFKSE